MSLVGGRDLDLADRLRAKGLTVVEVAGWQTAGKPTLRGHGSVNHHTAGPSAKHGPAPSLGTCINGRPDLPGPLCNVMKGRDQTCYVVASGKANHAGVGGWKGLSGNSSVYGLENENVGTAAEPWTPEDRDTIGKIHAAFAEGGGFSTDMVCQHFEWATPPGRKNDAHDWPGDDLRLLVARELAGAPAPPPTTNNEEQELMAAKDEIVEAVVGQIKEQALLTVRPAVRLVQVEGDKVLWATDGASWKRDVGPAYRKFLEDNFRVGPIVKVPAKDRALIDGIPTVPGS